MGRIVNRITIQNVSAPIFVLHCDALVDTGTAHIVLPSAWKERLGNLESTRLVDVELGNQIRAQGEVCGPVRIQLEGFPPVHGEVLFVDMHPQDHNFEPLIGYIALEQSQAAVDMVGHRLVYLRKVDLKSFVSRALPALSQQNSAAA